MSLLAVFIEHLLYLAGMGLEELQDCETDLPPPTQGKNK